MCRTSRLFEHLGISPPAVAAPAAATGVSGSRGHRPEQQRHAAAAAGALLNGEQVQKLLSFRRFVRTAGLGPREFVAGVRRHLAIEASQTFDEDGVTKSVAMAARRGDGARKRYRIASAREGMRGRGHGGRGYASLIENMEWHGAWRLIGIAHDMLLSSCVSLLHKSLANASV